MSSLELAQHIRGIVKDGSDVQLLVEVLEQVQTFVLNASSSDDPGRSITELQEQLQLIHKELVDTPQQTEVFLAVLNYLRPIITPSSIVTNWWDLVLRPALRDPKLSGKGVEYAQDLIISAFEDVSGAYLEEADRFRRQLMELFLLDALNEGSGEDILEFSAMDDEAKQKVSCWKARLENIIVRCGTSKPEVSPSTSFPCHSV
jgi:hypothetical protein